MPRYADWERVGGRGWGEGGSLARVGGREEREGMKGEGDRDRTGGCIRGGGGEGIGRKDLSTCEKRPRPLS